MNFSLFTSGLVCFSTIKNIYIHQDEQIYLKISILFYIYLMFAFLRNLNKDIFFLFVWNDWLAYTSRIVIKLSDTQCIVDDWQILTHSCAVRSLQTMYINFFSTTTDNDVLWLLFGLIICEKEDVYSYL